MNNLNESCANDRVLKNKKSLNDIFVESVGKKLRCGYTTGSCATAAATAATYMLFNDKNIEKVIVNTPKEVDINIEVNFVEKCDDYVIASVIKDAGDDSDVTHGIEVFAKATKSTEKFKLIGGTGIGIVTKDGLSIPKGEYAINPIPRKMIKESVLKVLKEEQGVLIEIFIPQGVEIAKRTFNPRLGIEGGISVLGTTGIVYPMSEEALKESIRVEINQKSIGRKRLVLTIGNIGERCARDLGYAQDEIVIISNFIGFALECVAMRKVEEVILVGHIGKISKVAYGCFNTHSRVNDVRLEVIALELALMGESTDLIKNVMKEKTSEGAVKLLGDGYEQLYKSIGDKIKKRMEIYTYNEIKCEAIMYSGYSNYKVLYNSIIKN